MIALTSAQLQTVAAVVQAVAALILMRGLAAIERAMKTKEVR